MCASADADQIACVGVHTRCDSTCVSSCQTAAQRAALDDEPIGHAAVTVCSDIPEGRMGRIQQNAEVMHRVDLCLSLFTVKPRHKVEASQLPCKCNRSHSHIVSVCTLLRGLANAHSNTTATEALHGVCHHLISCAALGPPSWAVPDCVGKL